MLNALSTDLALDRARTRGFDAREANPLLRAFSGRDSTIYVSRAATGLLTAFAVKRVSRKHPRVAKVLVVVGTFVPLGASVWDLTRGAP